MAIEKMNPHYSMTNPASVYDEDALTALELAGRTAAKTNELVEAYNQLEDGTNKHLDNQDEKIQVMNDVTMPAKVKQEVTQHIHNGAFDQAINDYAGNLESRLDTLLGGVTEGSTNMDAEVIDIRTGWDNKVYPNSGAAVRNQINNLHDRMSALCTVEHMPGTNKINPDAIKAGYIDGANGGGVKVFDGLYYTDFIPVTAGTSYYHYLLYGGYYAFYDKNYNYLSGAGQNTELPNPFTPTGEASYARFTIASADYIERAWINISNTAPSPYGVSVKLSPTLNAKIVESVEESLVVEKHNPATNYINRAEITKHCYINGGSGLVVENSEGLNATGFVPLEENTTYYYGHIYSGYCAFYNENKEYISGYGIANATNQLPNPFTTPAGTKYARFTALDNQVNSCWIFTKNVRPGDYDSAFYLTGDLENAMYTLAGDTVLTPCMFNGHDIQAFNRGVCIGDSLTAGTFNYTKDGSNGNYLVLPQYSYPKKLAQLTGLEITNLGNGGATSEEWYDRNKNKDLSGYDFAIVQLGVNDLYRYGGWSDRSITAFTNIINKLKSESPGIKIFVGTIMPAVSYSASVMGVISDGIRNFVSDLMDPDVILIDLASYGTTIDTAYNCGHLSAYGYYRLAQDYYNAISYYMNNNKGNFRSIQFIGTDYQYTD